MADGLETKNEANYSSLMALSVAVTYQSKYTCTTRKCHRHRIQDRIYFQNPVYKMDTLVVYMHRFTPGYIPV